MAYRLGLIGTGGMARAHGRACGETGAVDLVAIHDVVPEHLESYGEEFGVEGRYTDLDQMLNEGELDIVLISTWGAFHAEVGIRVAQSQKVRAILCEKPITQSVAEAEAFAAAAAENGVVLAEAFKFRHHPMHLKAKEMVEAGAIGDLLNLRSTFCTNSGRPLETRTPASNWRFNKAQGGGSIYDLACYNIHHARFIFEEEPLRVFASDERGIEVDDAASIVLVFSAGRTAQVSVGFNSFSSQYAEISGDSGMLRLNTIWNNENRAVTLEYHSGAGEELFEFGPLSQLVLQLEHMCECLETGRAHRISPQNSVAQMRVLDAVKESMETGEVVEV